MRNIWITDGRPRGPYFESYSNYKLAKRIFRNKMMQNNSIKMTIIMRKMKPQSAIYVPFGPCRMDTKRRKLDGKKYGLTF